jgi:hypothetical protein
MVHGKMVAVDLHGLEILEWNYLYDPSGCRIAAFKKKAAVRHLRNRAMSSPQDDRLSPIGWTWP